MCCKSLLCWNDQGIGRFILFAIYLQRPQSHYTNYSLPPPPDLRHHEYTEDATGGYSRLASDAYNVHNHDQDQDSKTLTPPRPDVTHMARPLVATGKSPIDSPVVATADANGDKHPAGRTSPPDRPGVLPTVAPNTSQQGRIPTLNKDTSTSRPDLQVSTIRECLQRNAAFRPREHDEVLNVEDDDLIFVSATDQNGTSAIDNILLQADHCGTLVNVCKEIILGWPQSFAHADDTYLAKLAACYSIHFQSYMCYAVTALRTLAHAPWKDDMFFGHIRELVLCAIGNGWTWSDQSASVQGRRISTAEVCAAFASYTNLTAFPPGQVSDLDTAIIAVCDDLFPEHVSLFFATFNLACPVCNAKGSVSVPVFDSLLIRSPTDNGIHLPQMLAHRTPRLALEREDTDFVHAPDCTNAEHITYHQTPDYLMFTLKITCLMECLPTIADVLGLLDQTFDVRPIGSDMDPRPFTVTGILIVQGNSSHHFAIIERFHQQQVLIYDNLIGYKWLPLSEVRPSSKAWGFIFRRQNHESYSFQPQQYKAIAPDVRKGPKPSPSRKSVQGKSKSSLGINAKKYNCPALPNKPSKNDPTCKSPASSTFSAAQQEQKKPHEQHQQTHAQEKHSSEDVHGGVLTVGQSHCISDDLNVAPDATSTVTPKHSHPGVLRVGNASTEPHSITPVGSQAPQCPVDELTAKSVEGDALNTGPPAAAEAEQKEAAPPPHDRIADISLPGHEVTVPISGDPPTGTPFKDANQIAGGTLCAQGPTPPIVPRVIPLPDVHASGCNNDTEPPPGANNDVSPPKRLRFSELHPYAIISLFDGVGSAIPAITKAIGGPPKLIIAAECDPILRQLVGEQFQFRTDGRWTQSCQSTFTLYAEDVRELVKDRCRILREAFAIVGTQCRWIVIAGSPCQDLTPAGPFKGLLGLTGQSSSLFYYVHAILWLLQTNYPTELVRFLLENAGTMLEIHRKAILRALGLNPDANPDYFRVDPKHTHGIKRNRFYFRNYTDRDQVPKTVVLNHNDSEGPLLDQSGAQIPFGPLLRVRTVLGHDVFQLSWTSYQPISLVWDYSFWGSKQQFQAQAKMQCSDTIPSLDFTNSLPPHYLRAWKHFLRSLKTQDISPSDRDNLVRAILPIFHHPFITAPMRILSCEEVEKLAGLHNHFHRVQTHRPLLTEYTIRNYCGNSFHPEHIQAAIGNPERLRNWLAEPINPASNPTWTGVIHPKEARAQFHQLRDQVQTIAQQKRIKDVTQKQIGLDPMPDFPIHAIDGYLTPISPAVMPMQLLPPSRRIHPEEVGLRDDKPPSQLSLVTIRLLQQQNMQDVLTGMRFFGAGISQPDDIFPFVFSEPAEAVMDAYHVDNKQYFLQHLGICPQCTHSMAQLLLLLFAVTQRAKSSIHIVHISDWEDHARIVAFGDAPAQWTIYCVQFPKSQAFHMDTIAWNCRTRMNIPWPASLQLRVCDIHPVPFICTNEHCEWVAVPCGPDQFLVSNRKLGDFLYQGCIPCLFSWLIPQVSCPTHLKPSASIEIAGTIFVNNEGAIIAASAQEWPSSDLTSQQTFLAKAAITDQLAQYTTHQQTLPHATPIGSAQLELVQSWIPDTPNTLGVYMILSP